MTAKRQLLIQPYTPDEVENLGNNTGQYSSADIGKPLKYNGDIMDAPASGDAIAGFVTSVEPGTKDGHSIGAVRKTGRMFALDEAGTLTVGAVVVAGTPVALGTQSQANVIAEPIAGDAGVFPWIVLRVDGAGAGRVCLIGKP